LETVHQDIHDAADPLLDAETFETAWTYDALGRVVTHTTPDQSVTEQSYSPRGLVSALAVKIRGAGTATDIVTAVAYNARGQRLRVDAANDVVSNFEYDPATFRVRRIHTERPHTDPDLRRVQDLRYHYDPVGNITRIRDLAQAGVFFDNAYADPTQSFTYDPLYRLTQATGREHDALPQPTAEGFAPIAHPQDTQAQRNYAANLHLRPRRQHLRMKHSSGGVTVWHRGYTYATTGNRLLATTLPGDDLEDPEDYSEPYTYDAHGNMTAMPTIPGGLTWDPQDRLIKTDHQGGGVTYYVYDSAGQRVRKVHLNQAATISTERYYLGPWETYKKTTDLQGTPTLDTERETLHVHTPAGADCLIETKTVEDETPLGTPTPLLRYQHHNHLGTATLELSQDAEVITYEEYHPYGTSAYRAANSAIEASPKRYRYTGKERDEETGLYYHEARYYGCWLARWISADPDELVDGPNRFQYTTGRPTALVDSSGMAGEVPSILSSISVENRAFGKYIVEENDSMGSAVAEMLEPLLPGHERISRAEFDRTESLWNDITTERTPIIIRDVGGRFGPFRDPVIGAIGTLMSKPKGRELVRTLVDESRMAGMSVEVIPGRKDSQFTVDNTLYVTLRPPGQPSQMERTSDPLFVRAGHEFIHVVRELLKVAVRPDSAEEKAVIGPTPGAPTPTENDLRLEHALPPRNEHGYQFRPEPLREVSP
jgi:RHS repeat-associated protein